MYIYNLGQRFIEIANQNKDKTAIIFNDTGSITYRRLNDISNKIVNYFLNYGIVRNDVVAIQNNKSVVGFATMIACLKMGVIYTNFDYTNPTDRIKKIFETASPKIVFADSMNTNISELCTSMNIPYINTDCETMQYEIDSQSNTIDRNIVEFVPDCSPAYIMFTSGSTGIPKGVLISQRSIMNFIEWGKSTYQLRENDILTNVNPIYFDNSVFDFYCSVFNGLTMAAISKDIVEKPKEMLKIIDNIRCTLWFSVPSMLIYLTNLKLLGKQTLQSIRIFSFGGEGYPKELLRKLYGIYADQAEFYNVYGPTEGTCICSAYKIKEEDIKQDGLTPLGHIAANFDYLILDERENESNYGELCLLGNQLALGYYNDAERTNKSFVRCEKYDTYNVKMYKTGDLVENVDGVLFFRGRIDNQIKHMGYRVELEEIESALIKIENVKQCAVIHTLSKNNFSKLIGFIATEKDMDSASVRNDLKRYIPNYMIPNSFKFMKELPKNANGKVDRVALKKSVEWV